MTPLAKRLWIALAVSIALNLLVGGILIGRAFRHRPPPPPHGEAVALERERGDGRELDARAARRGPLRELFRENKDAFRDRRRAMGEARRAARTALETEPFDRAALERALEALRKETGANQEVLHRAIVEAAVKAPPEERRKLAQALERATFGRDVGRGPGPPRGR